MRASKQATRYQFLDRFAVFLSAVCIAHCLILPLVIVIYPLFGSQFLSHELFHIVLLFFVIPSSAVSLVYGCRRHLSRLVMWTGFLGVTLLFFVAVFGHDLLPLWQERVLSVIGAIVVAFAHIVNYRLCKQLQCASNAK